MKTKTKEIISNKTVYEAFDGTEFTDSSECKTYEESAVGVLMGRLVPFIIYRGNEYDAFCGSEDTTFITLCIKDKETLKTLEHLYRICYPNTEMDFSKYYDTPIIIRYYIDNNRLEWITIDVLNDIVKYITNSKYILMDNVTTPVNVNGIEELNYADSSVE